MSELNLNPALLVERPAGLPIGLPTTGRSSTAVPAPGTTPAAPFADLIAGFLQGTQPPAPAAVAPLPEFSLAEASADGAVAPTDPLALTALTALPGSATALPPAPVTSSVADGASGKALPLTGQTLPAADPAATPVAGKPASPDTAPSTDASPRISLADLALSRTVDPAPVPAQAVSAPANSGGRPVALKGTAAEKSAGSSPGLPVNLPTAPVTLSLATGVDNAPALRLSAADLLRNALPPGASADLPVTALAPQIAAFAAGGDSTTALSGTSPLSGSSGPDAGSAALLSRLGTTPLPPLLPLGNPASFAGGLADRLLTLGGVGSHTARLQLHPESLGKLDVEIQIEDGSAQVWFGTTTSQAREAIEASLPRLKELFADQGIALTRTQVDGGSGQMGNQSAFQQRPTPGGNAFAPDGPGWAPARGGPAPLAGLLPSRGPSTRLVDVWA